MKTKIKKPLYTAGLLMALGVPAMVGAAVEFEQGLIPKDFVQHLVGGGSFYRSLPDGFPVPSVLPAGVGLWVVGSHVGPRLRRVVLQSSVDPQQTLHGLRQAYLDDGWVDLSTHDANPVVCDDALGTLELRENSIGGDSRIEVNLEPPRPGMLPLLDCMQRRALVQAGGSNGEPGFALAQSLMPVLVMPAAAIRINGPGQFSGFSSNGASFQLEYKGTIMMPDTDATLLYGHFAPMLQEQGWTADSGDAGSRSSASIWYKSAPLPEEPSGLVRVLPLRATMLIVDEGSDYYRLQFNLQTVGVYDGGLGIRGIASGLVDDSVP